MIVCLLIRSVGTFDRPARERAENPIHIEDERIEYEPEPGGLLMKEWSFKSGKAQMDRVHAAPGGRTLP